MPESQVTETAARPFLKWAGGKTQLLNAIEARLPDIIRETGKIKRYVEPFVGGGAVFFHLQGKYEIEEAWLYDINRELIVGYRAVQEDYLALLDKLYDIEHTYLNLSKPERKKYFYRTRDTYNKQMHEFDYQEYTTEWIDRATMLIYLNKTCYNGLFRQNQKGEFNTPHGRYVSPTICDADNITAAHQALQAANIVCSDFKTAEQHIDTNTFVYYDPPYRPLNKTSSFTSYFKSGFTDENQRELVEFFHKMDTRGAYQLLSNSDPKNEDPDDKFFENLYAGESITIERVTANRNINRNGSDRGAISELIIWNY